MSPKLSPAAFSEAQRRKDAGGKAWETVIEVQHELYQRARRCYVQRTYPKMVRAGKFSVPAEPGPPDYLVIAQSRAFLIEAKQTTQGRWSFGLLTETQANHFDAAERHGAMGAVLLRYLTAGRTVLLLWTSLGPLWWLWKTKGSKGASLTLEQAEALASWSGRGADYLEALLDPLDATGPSSSPALDPSDPVASIPMKAAR